jgi:hypothetical protein
MPKLFKMNLQQRVLSRIFTGFPFNRPKRSKPTKAQS